MKKLLLLNLFFYFLLLNFEFANAQVPSYVPTSGLVAYYPFNGNANDASGNGNNGTVNGATLTSDRNGNANSAYKFDQANTIQNIKTNIALINSPYSNSEYSYVFWLKSNNSTRGRVFQHVGSNSKNFDFVRSEVSKPSNSYAFWHYDVGVQSVSPDTLKNLQWYQIAIIINSNNTVSVFRNGTIWFSSNYAFPKPNDGNITWGSQGNSFFGFDGILDDILVYKRALSQSEITGLYNAGTNTCLPSYLPTTGLVGYWPFCGNANDASGNGNNGMVNGATLTSDRNGSEGKAYDFSGSSDFLTLPPTTTTSITKIMSLSLWAKHKIFNTTGFIFDKASVPGFYDKATLLQWGVDLRLYNENSFYGSFQNVQDTNWHNYVAIWKDTSVKLYIDAVFKGEAILANSFTNTPGIISIGKANRYDPDNYSGKIDDIAIYNRSLSFSEIQNIYNAGASNSCIANITNNDTTICRGTSINLNAISNSISTSNTLIDSYSANFSSGWIHPFSTLVGHQYKLIVDGTYSYGSTCPNVRTDAAYDWYSPNQTNPVQWGPDCNNLYTQSGPWFLEQFCGIRPTPDVYNTNHIYDFYFTANASQTNIGFFDNCCYWDNCGQLNFKLYDVSQTSTYLWSTGATTPSITVSPTVTTKYYCTVSDGVNTCKDSVTVTVSNITTNLITADTVKVCGTSTTISATTGLASYAWSNGANTASTTVTSSGWYKCTANNGACTAVDSVYVSLFNPKITQNDTTVCAGTALTLTVNNNTALTSSLPANLRYGLVGYWPFNGNANDESGNGNNGTVNGATLTSDRFGNVGKAYSFDGVSNYINVNNSSSLNITGTQISISYWLRFENELISENYQGISKCGWDCGGGYELLFRNSYYSANDPGRVDLNSRQGNFNTNGILSYQNTWMNLTATFNNGIGIIYFNGIQQNTVPGGIGISSFYPSNNNLYIGRRDPSNGYAGFLKGKIDDIAIYNRALSATEVQQLYSGTTSYLWSTTATTPSISVTPTATTSYIATVSNGINTCKDTVKITVTNITSLSPTTIFGAVDVCSAIGTDTASVPVNYKINKVANAASYVWTVPPGVSLLSGQGDTSIMVRFGASFVSGAITVKSVSTCNISSTLKSVTVYKRVAAAPTAIQKEFTPTSIVATTNVTGLVSEVYRIKKVLYATSYNWYLNRGTSATITHINAAGVNDTAVIVTFASCFVKDTLSVKSVSPCSISTAKTVIMSSSTTPATVAGISAVGGDFAVCIGSSKTFRAIAGTPTTTQVGIASFRWTTPLNTTITSATSDSSTITVSFNTGFTGGSISAKGVSSCGVVGTVASTAVLQYLPPTPLSIGSSTNSYNACINSSVTYTAWVGTATTSQAPAAAFRWTRPNNTSITSATADSSSITVHFNTGYTGGVISVKSQSRCGTLSAARSQTLTHTGCALGTKMSQPITTTNNNSFEVSLYPNPTANAFKLLIKNNKASGLSSSQAIVKVIDIQGRMMKSFQANTNQVISIGNELKPGVYMVEVRLGEEVKVVRAVKF